MLLPLKNMTSFFLKQQKGAATVEFTLTIIIFLVVLGSFLELARLSFLSAYVDSATSLAVREVKNTEGVTDYVGEVQRRLNDGQQQWSWLNNGQFHVDAVYYPVHADDPVRTVRDIYQRRGQRLTPNDQNLPQMAWTEYTVNYEYHPMFSWFPSDVVNPMLRRTILVLQEHSEARN